ncbi:MAG: enolase C-terminal domain-like protein [Acidobacteriota bacterium]
MSKDDVIGEVIVTAYTIPTDEHESDGTFEWDSTTIVIVEIKGAGKHGLGYSYTTPEAGRLIKDQLTGIIKGTSLLGVTKNWELMLQAVRNIGSRGIAASAISAVDIALWDLKAKFLGLPLTELLGQVHSGISAYGSGGFTSYTDAKLQSQLGGWIKEGFKSVKMKIGREPLRDIERIKKARDAIGEKAELFIDANGAFSKKEALQFAETVRKYNISWFEEPVSSDDLAGLSFLVRHLPPEMELAAGEYGFDLYYFRRMLEASAVDVLQADATRCLGITGFMKAGVLTESRNIFLSAHTAPSIHLHPSCSTQKMKNIEYFHDHARIEDMFFDGAAKPKEGVLYPDLSRPGLGLELKRKDIEKFRVL